MQQASVVSTLSSASIAPQRARASAQRAFRPASASSRPRQSRIVVRAQEGAAADDDFDARLAALKKAKGEKPYGAGKKGGKTEGTNVDAPKSGRKQYDFTDETLFFESGPHTGDAAVNVALGATLIWLPLSIASIGRALFVKYRFTDLRISCITTAPWKNEQLDAAYQEVKSVVSIGRGVGLWGDMCITLTDGSKIEMRSLPRFKEMERYILERRDQLTGGKSKVAEEPTAAGGKGFA